MSLELKSDTELLVQRFGLIGKKNVLYACENSKISNYFTLLNINIESSYYVYLDKNLVLENRSIDARVVKIFEIEEWLAIHSKNKKVE